MSLKIQHIVIIITFSCFWSCGENPQLVTSITGMQIPVESSINGSDSIETFIEPYRRRVDEVLDSALAYAPYMISKTDGKYNTTAGNLIADLMLSEAREVFRQRTGEEIDFALLNHGGIRSIISKGPVSARTAYELMPFDNTIVVVSLKGKYVRDLVTYLIRSDKPHPIAGLEIRIDRGSSLVSVSIGGVPFDENRTYNVATSNYLLEGGDNMVFFKGAGRVTETDYYIRNAIIDYFKKTDTLRPVVDDRFVQIK